MIVRVIGAGPAGSCAAISALQQGAQVSLFEKSQFPRHKVCGEFLSPEVAGLLDNLGVWATCEAQGPATLRSIFLLIGKRTKSWKLAEPGRGLSRHSMDQILMRAAMDRGAMVHREQATPREFDILAGGRKSQAEPGNRLFGFKAHYTGPADDVMGLYFFEGAYVGVNAVENGRTNVCGVAREDTLRALEFRIDSLLERSRPLAERLQPLTREMEWLKTGPLVFGPNIAHGDWYVAGDAAAFIDPFTGSGMLGAVASGVLAGIAASRRSRISDYKRESAGLIHRQQKTASILRMAIDKGWAERCLPLIPGKLLFHSTRPRPVILSK